MTTSNTIIRDALRQQIASMGLETSLCQALIRAVDHGTDEEVERVHLQIKSFNEEAPVLLERLEAALAEMEAAPTSVKRIGLYGGTFDPPHLSHLALARRARDELQLDELRLLPAGNPWQKTAAGRAPAAAYHRLAMLGLITQGEHGVVIDDREVRRSGPSYSVETVKEIVAENPGAQLFLIMGQDQYARLHTWRQWQELLGLVTVVVADRDGLEPTTAAELESVTHDLRALSLGAEPWSSSLARDMVARGDDITKAVGPAVTAYVVENGLYRGVAGA